ncbi:alpha/beta hydrolase [Paenibacillus sp. OSY-SE]|uniref:alpha/beta hydrolase n=1 Tax=Paenibacillus sp. OSY-SE TaxID=1196323 RepID=UPI0002DDDDE1|nr:alpha/beta hydrolase [Paenibacillus sp. OSY-SE]
MNISRELLKKITVNLGEETRITKCLAIGPVDNPHENDFFNYNLQKIFRNLNQELHEKTQVEFVNGKEYLVKYFDNVEKFNGNCSRPSLDFSEHDLTSEQRIFIIANIYSSEEKEVIIRLGRTNKLKLWMNEKLIYNKHCEILEGFYQPVGFSDTILISTYLTKGDNVVVVELNSAMVSIKINETEKELSDIDGEILKDYYNLTCSNKINVIQQKSSYIEEKECKFMVIPRDFINLSSDSKIQIQLKNKNFIIDHCISQFYETINIDLEQIRQTWDELFILSMEIHYLDKNSFKHKSEFKVLVRDIDEEVERINNYFIEINNQYKLNNEDKINIAGRIADFKKKLPIEYENTRPWAMEREATNLKKIFEMIESGKKIIDYIKKGGINRVYFLSNLDDSMQSYTIRVPFDYKESNSYPIIINLREDSNTDFLEFHDKFRHDDILMAEVSTRGFTQGSYIGEAAILEAIHQIIDTFNINPKQISLIGYSTGAFSVWGMIQNYPDLCSSVATISGFPYEPNLKNVSNVHILNISNDNDDLIERAFIQPNEILGGISDKYENILLRDGDHLTLYIASYSKYLIDWLRKFQRDERPRKIYFRTERLRHNKAYWAEIVDFFEDFGLIEAEITDKDILLNLTNIKEMLIEPPYGIENENFCIRIRNDNLIEDVFKINNFNAKLCIYHEDGHYKIRESKSSYQNTIKKNKGMGLLDIYMDSLKIVVPSHYENEEIRIAINKTASKLAKINTLSVKPSIQVNYPIVTEKEVSDSDTSNLILISAEDTRISIYNNALPFELYKEGFYYNNHFVEGQYCILFITYSNQLNKNKKIMVIHTNQYGLLEKNLFLRKIIMPSYSNGLHPYLNNEALIFCNNKYYVIDCIGNEIKKL